MGNCFKSCKLYRKSQRNVTLVVVGLDNSGKTTMIKRLAGEPVDSILKTLGFSLVVLRYHNYQISIYDLGGSAQIRDIWNKYFMDAHGIIFLVDSSDANRLGESKLAFAKLVSHENIAGKPILFLANKQDKEHALDELEIVEQLDVERVVNEYRCPTRVEICSALTLEKSKIDIGIKNGFRWLVDTIIRNYQVLNDRVQHDMAEFALKIQQDKQEWKNRVMSEEHTSQGDTTENGNPFQPIDQVIKNIVDRIPLKNNENKVQNGATVKKVLIDNYVTAQSSSVEKIPDFSLESNSTKSQKIIGSRKIEKKKRPLSKLSNHYTKNKMKFTRFNKTAPMPIDILMQDNSETQYPREPSKYSIRSNFPIKVENEFGERRNYLTRRPASAPSKFHFSTVKVNAVWDLAAPLDISTTTNSKTLIPLNNEEIPNQVNIASFI